MSLRPAAVHRVGDDDNRRFLKSEGRVDAFQAARLRTLVAYEVGLRGQRMNANLFEPGVEKEVCVEAVEAVAFERLAAPVPRPEVEFGEGGHHDGDVNSHLVVIAACQRKARGGCVASD